MLGDEPWLGPFDELPHSGEMRRVQPLGTPERQARAVKRHGVVAADRVETRRRASSAQIVLGVHLEPRRGGVRLDDFQVVAETQPDPGLGRDRVARSQRSGVRVWSVTAA